MPRLRSALTNSPFPALAVLTLMRPHQWVKNAFVVAPLLLTPTALSIDTLLPVAGGLLAFCAVASGMYILNDFLDREADRAHPTKRLRPLAAGTVSPAFALGLCVLLLAGGLGLSLWLSFAFAVVVAVYVLLNIAYSVRLKHLAIVDVFVIAFGFVLRVEAGALLADINLTVWITIIVGLLALFIALGKRRDDLVKTLGSEHRRSLEGYNKAFLDASVVVVLGALLVAYLIYTTDVDVMERLGTENLFFSAPWVVAGVMRYLQIIFVDERSGSPTLLVLTDRFLITVIAGWAITLGILLYV
ncbi:MAG: UbiA prenyltransferase family protein [Dehalococcoidia bacterium]